MEQRTLQTTVPKLELNQVPKEESRKNYLRAGAASPRVCAPGAFSTAGRTASPRRVSQRPQSAGKVARGGGPSSPAPRTMSPARSQAFRETRTEAFDHFDGQRAYRTGGGYSSTNQSRINRRSPEKDEALKTKVVTSVQTEADARPPKKLNERQWEKVVTRLYGTPGGADDPMNRGKIEQRSEVKKVHPAQLEATVERLYNPNPNKEKWLMSKRVEILEKELRQCQSKPTISRTSKRMAEGKLHIMERTDNVIAVKQQKMAELISRVEQDESGDGIRGTPNISDRAQAMPRTYQDRMSWHAEKAERLQQQREAKVVDEISCPFHPEIDKYSEELAMRRFHKEGCSDLPAEERLYSLRDLPTEDQVERARMIHHEDLKHSLALSAQY